MINYKTGCIDCDNELNPLYHRGENKKFETVTRRKKYRGQLRNHRAFWCPHCKEVKWKMIW